MSFWDILGKIAGVAAPIVTAPFTAGTSLAALPSALGKAVGGAATAAGNNRLNQEELALQANRDNITGNTAAETALLNRSKQEGTERRSALIDMARASDTRNQNISPFNTRGPKKYSDDYMQALTALEQAGLTRLKADPTYSTNHMAGLRSYQPLDIKNLQGSTNTQPSIWERRGQFAGPALSVVGALTGQPRPEDDPNFGG